MHLINTETYELEYFLDSRTPKYAILSHCWTDAEVNRQEYLSVDKRSPEFQHVRYKKIRNCCELALKDGLKWAWIDTCCIEKTSSAELSEAINSMFEWYRYSEVCYAFLDDAPEDGDLAHCRWFTRGWTLQELLAPHQLYFFGQDLKFLGSRNDLACQIETITKIDRQFLACTVGNESHGPSPLSMASIAQRMSWAATRTTTRAEDVAYSLLGIFGVNMPLLYGEGPRAFIRLQEHIIAQSQDESIFAWTSMSENPAEIRNVLAIHPLNFRSSSDIVPKPFMYERPPYTLTCRGLAFPVIPASMPQRLLSRLRSGSSRSFSLELQCIYEGSHDRVTIQLSQDQGTYCRIACYELGRNAFERGYMESFLLGGYSTWYLNPHSGRRHHIVTTDRGSVMPWFDCTLLGLFVLILALVSQQSIVFSVPNIIQWTAGSWACLTLIWKHRTHGVSRQNLVTASCLAYTLVAWMFFGTPQELTELWSKLLRGFGVGPVILFELLHLPGLPGSIMPTAGERRLVWGNCALLLALYFWLLR